LVYVARVRNGFVPASRRQVFEKIRGLVSPEMPFANLPDEKESGWGDSLTAEKMKASGKNSEAGSSSPQDNPTSNIGLTGG
jgi:hypothetical protein